MKRLFAWAFILWAWQASGQPFPRHDLVFDSLASHWDEGIPLGNGWLGALIWQKGNRVRLSLDRVDLWDERPMPGIDRLTFQWVKGQVLARTYDTVQKSGDAPYEENPAPTKIPGAALEFDFSKFGKVVSSRLDLKRALSIIRFQNGTVFNNYIHAVKEVGYFGLENLPVAARDFVPELLMPNYHSGKIANAGNSVNGQGLESLGYAAGTLTRTSHSIRYHQPTWNGNFYEVLVEWQWYPGNHLIGAWTISVNHPASLPPLPPGSTEPTGWKQHLAWWTDYWSRSSVAVPDPAIEKQYYLEMYKFGSVVRANTPPISLQAIWTADNGNLPPWKGDYHHDLNTELSYWPGYTANHLDLTESYTRWLWKIRPQNREWTQRYFGVGGLNVPGVTTLAGHPMGGWIQYSMSPTTGAWLAQHFYWQWQFSRDPEFLREKALPYLNEVREFTENLIGPSPEHLLPLSSSPEYHDNSIGAWFLRYTNYDLALVKNIFAMDSILVQALHSPSAGKRMSPDLPDFDINSTGLTIAPGQNLDQSHRHHAHLLAIYPAGLLNPDLPEQKRTIETSLRWLEQAGTRNWCGYSFSWAACIYARAREGENALKMLGIFSSHFCSPNSFHLNGDQGGGTYSDFTYRPFTLEGNFAFAQGLHEMLLQGYNGYVEVFPAIPDSWQDLSFTNLRTEGAFLVSARKENGMVTEVRVRAEMGGRLKLKRPFPSFLVSGPAKKLVVENGFLVIEMKKGETLVLKNAFE
jgi:alpha-L-fucosidase 2